MQLEAYGGVPESSAPKGTAQAEDPPPSDALVIFGFTGDLASKKIFPALYAMVKRGVLTVPVIGVASSKWSCRPKAMPRRARLQMLAAQSSTSC